MIGSGFVNLMCLGLSGETQGLVIRTWLQSGTSPSFFILSFGALQSVHLLESLQFVKTAALIHSISNEYLIFKAEAQKHDCGFFFF